jgi:hypothetical protein
MTDPDQTNQRPTRVTPLADLLAPLVQRLDSMDATQVRAWLDDVLAERASLPRALPDDSPVPTLIALDPLLDDIHRDHLRRALRATVADCLHDAPEGDALAWALLILTRVEDRKIGHQLAAFVNGPDFAALPADTKCRILSTIVDLRFAPGNVDFWERLLQDQDAGALSGLVFQAIAETDPLRAVKLLPDLPTGKRTLDQLALAHLPQLWEFANRTTRESIRQELVAIRRNCRSDLADALDEFAEDANVDLVPGPEAILPTDKLDALLRKLAPSGKLEPMAAGITGIL